jgi:hypothetical protein
MFPVWAVDPALIASHAVNYGRKQAISLGFSQNCGDTCRTDECSEACQDDGPSSSWSEELDHSMVPRCRRLRRMKSRYTGLQE